MKRERRIQYCKMEPELVNWTEIKVDKRKKGEESL